MVDTPPQKKESVEAFHTHCRNFHGFLDVWVILKTQKAYCQ